jgi:hypothetical protein
MDVSPMTVALISVLGCVLVFMLGLIVTMISGVKQEVKEMRAELGTMLPEREYRDDKKAIDVRLDEHGQKILRLEIKVINGGPAK